MSIREFDFQNQRVRVRTTSCANAHVACNFGHHAILLDVKANFAKRGTPIQSQNSHDGSSLIVVLKKSSARQHYADPPHPLALLCARRERPRGSTPSGIAFPRLTWLRSAGSHPARAASAHRILYVGWLACNRIGALEHRLAELPPSRCNFEDMPNRPAPGSPEYHLPPPS